MPHRCAVVDVREHLLEVQARDRLQALEIADRRRVDHLEQRALAVDQPEDRIVVIGDVAESRSELAGIDLEAMGERRQLFEQARPFVEPAHALHQQALRARRDHLAATHGTKHDLEVTLAPGQQAIDRVLALQRTGLGIDHATIAEVDRRLPVPLADELDHA